MSTKTTKPEEKGFFEKVKETIEELWDGTKEKAGEIKDAAGNTYDNLKHKATAEKATAKKKVTAAKKTVANKTADADVKAKTDTAKAKKAVTAKTTSAKSTAKKLMAAHGLL